MVSDFLTRFKFIFILLIFLSSCETYVTERKTVTLSGKYVISKVRIQSADQNTSSDSNYLTMDIVETVMPYPFDSFMVDNLFLHFDYSQVMLNLEGVQAGGRDIWEIGPYRYWILNSTPYYSGDLQFTYEYTKGNQLHKPTLTFTIEDDGLEHLQLKSKGIWPSKEFGEQVIITFFLTRLGP